MRPILPLLLSSLVPRETPQELSHDRYILQVKQMLDLNNTLGVHDPTYGLLVNSMAVTGMGSVTDPNCLQLSIADTAFTNAKATNNIEGLVAALIYRALERNTPAVGVTSELCTSFTPLNPELSTFKQHQDPASPGALANNKATVLELARQIYLVGGNATEALYSGTFAPGNLGDNDTAGNSCDTTDCIFAGDLLVQDASNSEVTEYVANCRPIVTSTVSASRSELTSIVSNGSTTRISLATSTNTIPTTTHTTAVTTTSVEATTTNSPAQTTTVSQAQAAASSMVAQQQSSISNDQTFTGAFLGVTAPAVTGPDSSGNFHVDTDQSSFINLITALARSCDIQKNNCANLANQQRQPVSTCDAQLTECKSQTGSTNA